MLLVRRMSNKVPLQSVPSCPEFFRRDNPWKAPVVPLLKVNRPDTRHPAGVPLRDLEYLTGRHRDPHGRDADSRHACLVGLGLSHDDLGGCICVRMHEYCHGRVFSANITPGCAKPGRNSWQYDIVSFNGLQELSCTSRSTCTWLHERPIQQDRQSSFHRPDNVWKDSLPMIVGMCRDRSIRLRFD